MDYRSRQTPTRRLQFVADHLVDQIVDGRKTASVVPLGEVNVEEDQYNSPLVVGDYYDVHYGDLRRACTVRITGMELCRWSDIPERLWRGESNSSAREFRRDHQDFFDHPGEDFEFVAYYFARVDD